MIYCSIQGFHVCEDVVDHIDQVGRFEPVKKDTKYLSDAARFAVEKSPEAKVVFPLPFARSRICLRSIV